MGQGGNFWELMVRKGSRKKSGYLHQKRTKRWELGAGIGEYQVVIFRGKDPSRVQRLERVHKLRTGSVALGSMNENEEQRAQRSSRSHFRGSKAGCSGGLSRMMRMF